MNVIEYFINKRAIALFNEKPFSYESLVIILDKNHIQNHIEVIGTKILCSFKIYKSEFVALYEFGPLQNIKSASLFLNKEDGVHLLAKKEI